MASPTKIQHPLLRHPGTSQRKRGVRSGSLRPDLAPIDGRTLGDMLDFVYEYARLVVFHEHKTDANGQGYTELSNWLVFFRNSLPFTLNRFSRLDFNRLDADLRGFHEAVRHKPDDANLRLLLDFCYYDLLTPLNHLQLTARESDFSPLLNRLERAVRTTLSAPLQDFIKLNNAAVKYFCTNKYDLMIFAQAPWEIPCEDLSIIDESVVKQAGGKDDAVIWLSDNIVEAAQRFLKVQRGIAVWIPGLLNASIDHLEKQNHPHLGLLYTFLRLFKHFQGDLNNLTQKHLEFFYREVLNLKLRKMEPDQVHLVFEPAKHLDSHLVKQGTLFKDGKDGKNTDILFGLDEEVVIDHAKVVALKTLFLKPSQGSLKASEKDVPRPVEGVYIAPVANSADGKGEAFQDGQSKNWAALGAKESKYAVIDEDDKPVIQNHLPGRVGFVLASPVLWLNEGQRDVTIKITCDASCNLDVFSRCFHEYINKLDENEEEVTDKKIFALEFSGADGWFPAKNAIQFQMEYADVTGKNDQTVTLTFQVRLDKDEPAVAFYDEEVIEEFLAKEPTKETEKEGSTLEPSPFPMVKILLKPGCYIECDAQHETRNCCLAEENNVKTTLVSPYHFLRDLEVKDTVIDVKVCGIKNLIVQNEESLQNVNSLIFPFGTRPQLHADFFIGTKELLCKNWKNFQVNIEWKDKPDDFEKHYKDYDLDEIELESEPKSLVQEPIKNDAFRVDRSILESGEWVGYGQQILFPDPQINSYSYLFPQNQNPTSSFEKFDNTPLQPLNVKSRDAFIRLRLRGSSFQHMIYPFALGLYLMQLANIPSENSINEIKKVVKEAKDNRNIIIGVINDVRTKIDGIKANIDKAITQLNKLIQAVEDQAEELQSFKSDLQDIFTEITKLLDNAINFLSANVPALPTQQEISDAIVAIQSVHKKAQSLKELIEGEVDNTDTNDVDSKFSGWIGIIGDVIQVMNIKPLSDSLNSLDGLQLNETDNSKDGALVKLLANLESIEGKVSIDGRLPKEPYTPKIKLINIDYTACSDKVELIHLHPFPKTSKTETLENSPTLLPTFTDAGTLFIGLEKLQPLSNLNLLLQFAEATADSESGRSKIKWQYLAANEWKDLRRDFEILSDKTEQMTRSGIVKIALPEDISNQGNTIMPPTEDGQHLFWLKVSTPDSVAGVAELVAVHAQAAVATYQPVTGSDPDRVATPLDSEQVSKTLQPDFGIKKALQPYQSFGGRIAETNEKIPARMGELLRHKGRSVDAFDIEHLVLDAFPELFKCKCISHTLGLSVQQYRRDLEVAPGHMVVAVVPDLTKLESGDMSEPRVPVSILTKVKKLLQQRASPFAHIRVMNPRYEKVYVCVELQLKRGRNKTFYLSQFKTDLGHFMAPWYLGDSDKLSFGQHLVYSDVLGFVESLEYVEHVTNLHLSTRKLDPDQQNKGKTLKKIVPLTARSILTCTPEDITVITSKVSPETQKDSAHTTTLADFLRNAKRVDCSQETGVARSPLKKAHNGQ